MSERFATAGEALEFLDRPTTLGEPCENTAGGYHACATHGLIFPSNMVANAHTAKRGTQHVTFWMCHEHGPEAY